MTLAAGTRLEHYEINAPLGAGEDQICYLTRYAGYSIHRETRLDPRSTV